MENYTIKLTITPEQVSDMMVSVIEGGYSGWLHFADFTCSYGKPKTFQNKGIGVIAKIEYDREEDQEGANLGRMKITRRTIERGLQAFGEQCPKGLADLISENWDAITADCFFQCVVFGKVIYG